MTEPIDIPPLGLRVVDFVFKNVVLIGTCAVVFAGLGWGLSAAMPRPYIDSAVIGVGRRFIDEFLEYPQLAEIRLKGAAELHAAKLAPDAQVLTYLFKDKKHRPTGLISIAVRSEQPEATTKIRDAALNALIEVHDGFHEYESSIAKAQLERLSQTAKALEFELKSLPQESLNTNELMLLLYENHRALNGTRTLLSKGRLPKTKIVSRAPKPIRPPAKTQIFTLGGLILGAMLGIAIGAVRGIAAQRILKQ